MTQLASGDWIIVYTIYDNNGYTHDANGGTKLQVARSTDNARSWTVLSTISDPGRDLDNGQIIQLANGDLLLACRSVRWQESYRLYVYKSTNAGATWSYYSTIDQNNGTPGSLGNPDKGVYEPHFGLLADGRLAVFYANEKHVTESPSYSQIISEKISGDGGATWGSEIWVAWDPANSGARPGMPVWTKMNNGRYILVFELCGSDGCNVHYKTSSDAVSWTSGIGTAIPNQNGGPYIVSLRDGRLAVTSNTNQLSFSNDYGSTWYTNQNAPWNGGFPAYLWSSLYQTGPNEIAALTSVPRGTGGQNNVNGHNIQIKFGSLATSFQDSFASGNDNGWVHYGGSWTVGGGQYTVNSTSADKSVLTPWVSLRNFSLEADIKVNTGQGSLLFDVTNPSTGMDSFYGYGVGFDTAGDVWLAKWNNAWTELANAPQTIVGGTTYHLKVTVNNGEMKVYVNGVLKITHTDTTYNYGTIAVRGGFNNTAAFSNVKVTGFEYSNDFSTGDAGWTHYGGTWSLSGGTYNVASANADKSVLTSPLVTNPNDYTIEADMQMDSGQASLLFDVTNPATGTDSFTGYGAGIDTSGVIWLGKFSNSYLNLGHASAAIAPNTWYHMKIVVLKQNRFQVYLNGTLYLDVSDSSYRNGTIGVRGGFGNNAHFDNLTVY
jgi:hypothetical protein